jgi:hypothetical protein
MRSNLTRNRLHQAIYFGQISASSSLSSWFGLLLRLRLSGRGAVAVKQNAVGSQIANQRMQIVGQLLVVQESRHQAVALCGGAKDLARIIDRVLQIVGCFLCGCHCGTCLVDDSIQLL